MKALAAPPLALALILLPSCASAPLDLTNPAATPVSYTLALTIRDGQQDAFRSLMEEMVASTKEEPGTLVYEWFLGADGKTCRINEHFEDTAAYVVHSENFGESFADRFMPTIEVTGLTVYGNADAAAREMLAGMSPVYFEAFGGFRR